ncbi:MAG: hypothetical protein ABJC04_00445 [Verrucomicrobiota bacterium]
MAKKTTSPRKKSARQEQHNLDVEISFLEGIIRRDADYVEALQILGDAYTRRGKFSDGLNVDEQLSRLRPDDFLVHYNLACSYSLMEDFERASRALERALELGYRDFKWIAKDPDLKKLRGDSRYQRIEQMVRELLVQAP